jgi:hypothetical protein
MSQAFTIELPDALQQTHITPEQPIIQYLQTTKTTDETDPILSLIGTLDLGTTDLGENHDHYIGEALYQELRNAK